MERAPSKCLAYLVMIFVGLFVSISVMADGVDIQDGIGVAMNVEKSVYGEGEPVFMEFRLFNYTNSPIGLQYTSSQRFDFVIRDKDDREIWRWSNDKMFAQRISEKVLGPQNREMAFETRFGGRLEKGSYKLTGISTAKNYPASATVSILVN